MRIFIEFEQKIKRKNDAVNKAIHPFSARVSKYLTWIFIKIGVSANVVTTLFAFCGIASAYNFASDNLANIILGFFLFRLHIIFDVCDGEVARYTQIFNKYGYLIDQVIHLTVYPLILFCLFSKYINGLGYEAMMLYTIVLGIVLDISIKNLYALRRAETVGNVPEIEINKVTIKNYIASVISMISGFDGLLFVYVVSTAINSLNSIDYVDLQMILNIYGIIFITQPLIKLYKIIKNDHLFTISEPK